MGNLNGIEINASDILGIGKLATVLAKGVGTLYQPIHISRMAKAEAKQIDTISEAMRNNIELPVAYLSDNLNIDSNDFDELAKRAYMRANFQEMKKQKNIESVVYNAYEELKTTTVSDEPLDEDWITSFFDFVANISNHQMQIIWGKLLAGEIRTPGSFSIRTMDVLRKLSQKEAILFEKIVPFVLKCSSDSREDYFQYFLFSEESRILETMGVNYYELMLLNETGLINADNMRPIASYGINPNQTRCVYGLNSIIKIKNTSNETIDICIDISFVLTEAGKELYQVISTSNNDINLNYYMERCKHYIWREHMQMYTNKNIEIDII